MTDLEMKVAHLLDRENWHEERKYLRSLLLECGLTENVKWGNLCYTFEGANVAIIYALKAYCGIGFFKGSLLDDPNKILVRQTENSQAVRLITFKTTSEISDIEAIVKDYIHRAILVEKSGKKVEFKQKDQLVFSAELNNKFIEDPEFSAAFFALTLGRQRGYNLHFSAAKQSKTRSARIEKYHQKILDGKGMNDWK